MSQIFSCVLSSGLAKLSRVLLFYHTVIYHLVSQEIAFIKHQEAATVFNQNLAYHILAIPICFLFIFSIKNGPLPLFIESGKCNCRNIFLHLFHKGIL